METPKQAARSDRIVRLVSFAAAAVVCAGVLILAASMRYPLSLRPPPDAGFVVSEIVRPPPAHEFSPPHVERERAPEDALATAPEPPVERAGPALDEPVVIIDPVWTQRPRNPERYYPREAFMQGVAGQVVLDCAVELDGSLTCVVASETPPDHGFGQAALAIAAAHVMQPATRNGESVRGSYRMTVPFSPSG